MLGPVVVPRSVDKSTTPSACMARVSDSPGTITNPEVLAVAPTDLLSELPFRREHLISESNVPFNKSFSEINIIQTSDRSGGRCYIQ
jgi:hypothetical protein